ncbi:sigma E regulatory protein MucB/RseB [Pseudomonas aeruginosa]|nr:sigma E regulatory protein MucB/RseB [Pseudomonas aeruginosa]
MRTTSLLLLLGSLMAVPATQAADASDWLNRLAEADRQNSFQGTFVYERNGSFSTHEIWHRVESDGAVRERLLQLDGARQEVVRVDGRTQCISGGLADQLADAQLWPVRKFDPSQLASWYDLRLVGESRVAGPPGSGPRGDPARPASLRLRAAPGPRDRPAVEIAAAEREGAVARALPVHPVEYRRGTCRRPVAGGRRMPGRRPRPRPTARRPWPGARSGCRQVSP